MCKLNSLAEVTSHRKSPEGITVQITLRPEAEGRNRGAIDELVELTTLRRRHIRKLRDAVSDTPGAANNVLRLLKIVLNFAVDEEVIDVNPAARMKELKGGEYRSWTDEELAQFEAH